MALVFVAGAVVAWPRLPPVVPASAAPERFSAARALVPLDRWAAEPRPHGSAAHARVLTDLETTLVGLGLEVRRETSGALVNLVAGTPGDGPDGVWLTAHSDSVAAGPGAADDGLGLIVLTEAARALRASGVDGGLHLLITDGEEQGLLGATAHVQHAPPARRLVINVEARGTQGPVYMFQTAGPTPALLGAWRAGGCTAQASSLARTVYEVLPNDTDFTVFRRAGWWGYDFAVIDGAWRYHTAADTVAHLDPRSVQQMGDCVVGLSRAWLAQDWPAETVPVRAYAQLTPGTMVDVRTGWVRAAALGVAGIAVVGRRGAAWGRGVVAMGLAGALAVAAGSGLLGLAVAVWPGFTALVAEVAQGWVLCAVAGLSGVGAMVGARRLLRGPGVTRAWLLIGAGVGVVGALVVPEAGYVLLPGAMVAACRVHVGRVAAGATLAAALVAGMLLGPLVFALPVALTSRLLPVLAVLPVVLLGWVVGGVEPARGDEAA